MNKHFLLLGGPLSFLAYLVYLFSDLALFEHVYTFLALITVLFACVYLRAHVYRYQMVALWVFALMSLINYLGWGLFGNAQDEFAAFVYLLTQMMAVICCVIAYVLAIMGLAFKDGDKVLGLSGILCLLLLIAAVVFPRWPEHLHQAMFVGIWGAYSYVKFKD